MSECKTCRFYEQRGGGRGRCRNLINADIRYVGGGGDYSSSADCIVPIEVFESQGCELYDLGQFQRIKIRPQQADLQREREASNRASRAARDAALSSTDPNIGRPSLLGGSPYWP